MSTEFMPERYTNYTVAETGVVVYDWLVSDEGRDFLAEPFYWCAQRGSRARRLTAHSLRTGQVFGVVCGSARARVAERAGAEQRRWAAAVCFWPTSSFRS